MMGMKSWFAAAGAAVGIGLVSLHGAPASAAEVTVGTTKDNTLYLHPKGIISNGVGEHMFIGRNVSIVIRRAVFAFDLSSIPAGATITSAELQLRMSQTISGAQPSTLHKLSADWGEGASHAQGGQGGGANAQTNDATWLHTFYPDQFWANEGGDFVPTVSASLDVSGSGFYTWGSTDEMVADVQSWIDDPSSNYGWIMRGNEDAPATAKRFDTHEHPDAARRPALTITYVIAGDVNGDELVDVNDLLALLAAWGKCNRCPEDLDGSGAVDVNDLLTLLGNWTG